MNDDRLRGLLEGYAATRDRAARDEALELALPLAYAVARRFIGRGVEREDLEQVAAMALLKAIERFDPSLGYRFTTYAVPTIAGDLRNHIRDRSGAMKLPRDTRGRLYRLDRERQLFEQEHLRQPAAEELADRLRISIDELLSLIALREQTDVASLDAPLSSDGESTLASVIGSSEDGYTRFEDSEWMKWVMSLLSEQERALVTLRFNQRLGQREAAKQLGVSQMQVSRIERRLLERIRRIDRQ